MSKESCAAHIGVIAQELENVFIGVTGLLLGTSTNSVKYSILNIIQGKEIQELT